MSIIHSASPTNLQGTTTEPMFLSPPTVYFPEMRVANEQIRERSPDI